MKNKRFLLKFSYRNLWRFPKRTLIMMASLVIGTGFIIWNLNFAESGSKEMMKEFLAQYQGRYHITHTDYYDLENRKLFNNYKTLTDEQISDKSLFATTTKRVTAPVFASGQSKTLGILLTGLDVEQEKKHCSLYKMIRGGRFLDPSGDKEIILGKRLAERINVKLGDEVAVIGQAIDGSIANDLLVVVGFLDMGGGDLEESLAFTQISTAQDLMVLSDEAYHQRVSFDMRNEDYPALEGVAVTSWREILPEISVSVHFVDRFTWLISIIIMIVISLGLSNTLMITFFEREQEFQSLNIIGAKTSWITTSLMIELLLLGTIAVIFGDILGFIFTWICHIYPVDISLFTGGKNIIMGGMVMKPTVRLYSVWRHYWQVPMMIYFFLVLTMVYPLIRVIRRSKHAI
jgi:putative ABC transport system permease protein